MTRPTNGHIGAETGHDHAEALTVAGTGTLTYDTGTVRTGTRSWKFDSTGSNVFIERYVSFIGSANRDFFSCIFVRIPAATGLPGSNVRIFGYRTGTGTVLCSAQLTTGGKLRLLDQAGTQIGSDSAATLTTETWYRVELKVNIGTGAVDVAELRLDGTMVASTTTGNFGDTVASRVYFGWFDAPGASEVIFMDDFALNDGLGSVNNTWVGEHKVLLLLPISDSARDAGWVAGAGGTTNLSEAVNNIPPAGLDSAAATDTSQVENAVSTVTEEYDANMTDYTTAGVGDSEVVTAAYALIEGGNSATTGTDTMGVSVESNPVIAEVTPSIDVNDGTYPTGWIRGTTAVVENPSVTKGTSPVMSLRKNVATTRVNTCCFMGMYIDVVSVNPETARVMQPIMGSVPFRAIG